MLADLIRDAALARVARATAARDASLARLAELDTPCPQGDDAVTLAAATLRYEAWAAVRRTHINSDLARQTATLIRERDAARRAVGRAQVIDRLGGR